jgi:HSP20 family protein
MCKISSSLHYESKAHANHGREASADTYWVPNTDVYATDDRLVVKVELAGMKREDLELVVEGNRLKISGQRLDGCRTGKCKFLVMEINYGNFESIIELPAGYDLSRAQAAYHNGFLRIDVPVEARRPQAHYKVPVTSDAE